MVAYAGLVITSPLTLPGAMSIAPAEALSRAPKTVPILLVAGNEDQHTTVQQVEGIYRKVVDHAQMRVLPGKHLQMRELAKAAFDHVVVQFVEGVDTEQ